jgi:hypothetical protein
MESAERCEAIRLNLASDSIQPLCHTSWAPIQISGKLNAARVFSGAFHFDYLKPGNPQQAWLK